MEHESAEEHLHEHGIKPTAVRILVWRKLRYESEAFSLKDVEGWLPDMDRSSIFRTLRLFAENDLLHEIEDGTGTCKYCVCRCEGSTHLNHVHFTCTECGRTYCLEDQTIPVVGLPDGFFMKDAEYVIRGTCNRCSTRLPKR